MLFAVIVYAHHNFASKTEEQTRLAWQQEAQERGWDAIVTFYYWLDLRQMMIKNLVNSINTQALDASFKSLSQKYLSIEDSNSSLNMEFYLLNNEKLMSARSSEAISLELETLYEKLNSRAASTIVSIIGDESSHHILIAYRIPSTHAWAFTTAPLNDIFQSISQFNLPAGIKLTVKHSEDGELYYSEESSEKVWHFAVEELVGDMTLAFDFVVEKEFVGRFGSIAFSYFRYLGFISIVLIYLFSLILVNKIKLQQVEIRRRKKAEYELDSINKNLEHLVESRTTELKQANDELHATMSKLAEAQKLAALGNLVSAIAHKLNTPLGTTITALSHIEHEESNLRVKLESHKLGKQDLLNFLEQAEQATDIALNNTSRAAELVQNFKQLAKVQEKLPVEEFDIREVINSAIIASKQRCGEAIDWRKTKILKPILCKGFPALLEESLTSLFHNAWLHGLKQNEGIISCDIAINTDNEITIIVENTGSPISADRQERIFEPFYTDRLTEDSSGLGLYIVHNIIVNQMHGHIVVAKSSLGGARFEITIPTEISV